MPYTDVINPPALQSSTERYDWGDGSETTYVLGTTILGYSETSSWGDGETVDTNTSYYDADRGHVGL